jgi:small-conductance mechanosensitive channel
MPYNVKMKKHWESDSDDKAKRGQHYSYSQESTSRAKKDALKHIIIIAIVLGIILAITTYTIKPFFPQGYLKYLQVGEIAVMGYFAIEIVAGIAYRLSQGHSEQTAKSMKSLLRIAGAIIMIAFIIAFLSQDPVIAASISTISGFVIGFAASNIIGNAIGGIYLAIVRPFKIGDRIKIFGEEGRVHDIGLLYTRIVLQNGNHMLASNSSIISTQVVLVMVTGDSGEQQSGKDGSDTVEAA